MVSVVWGGFRRLMRRLSVSVDILTAFLRKLLGLL